MSLPCSALTVAPDSTLYHVGPALDHGPLPSIFYFALSGPDSLTKDPYNQMIQFLSGRFMRFFSLTLPAHEAGLPPTEALGTWAEEMAKGIDRLTPFLEQVSQAIHYVIHQQLALPDQISAAGLSRGGLIAAHVAARHPSIRALLQFAPVTKLSLAKEFQPIAELPLVHSFDLIPLVDKLCNRPVRIYIGNRDTRVSTRACMEFVLALAEASHRHPQVDLIVSPSVGVMGHGTPPETFRQGAEWISSF